MNEKTADSNDHYFVYFIYSFITYTVLTFFFSFFWFMDSGQTMDDEHGGARMFFVIAYEF